MAYNDDDSALNHAVSLNHAVNEFRATNGDSELHHKQIAALGRALTDAPMPDNMFHSLFAYPQYRVTAIPYIPTV